MRNNALPFVLLAGLLAQSGWVRADGVTPATPAATQTPAPSPASATMPASPTTAATVAAPATPTVTPTPTTTATTNPTPVAPATQKAPPAAPAAPAATTPPATPAATAKTGPATTAAPAAPTQPSPAADVPTATTPAAAPAEGTDALRPEGPVTVTADHAEWQQDGVMIYSGHVLLTSSSLTLKGTRIELQQLPTGQYTAKVDGKPAQMDHAASVDSKGQPMPPVNAKADSLRYDSRSSVVDLIGNSVLTRGKDQITGSSIRYNVAERRIEAAGNGSGGQVRIVIQPPPPSATAQDKKP